MEAYKDKFGTTWKIGDQGAMVYKIRKNSSLDKVKATITIMTNDIGELIVSLINPDQERYVFGVDILDSFHFTKA